MTTVYTITYVLLAAAGMLTVGRLLVGPTDLDRIVALDVLVILITAGVTVEIGMRREGWNIALVAVVALLGFLGSVTAARLVERKGSEQQASERHRSEGPEPGGPERQEPERRGAGH
ncbi:sodium:proton antiporter [Parafrankia colletiae]|uniref:Sodium:proton antiporter n=1 Tax=Parafrankia colletiae TaxID=573497 RepID=A0A1S1R8P2_9ACTN|nr:monovalent cation/H+ antiporter complex subunit F [Parafrankia colletiae]MCK9900870.1 monovalent cation/H+ antiporter complex subunit F [Frankia sp. Cpl3]OHV43278.1 sodium:proton antiporter [Parafrankia colletiae]